MKTTHTIEDDVSGGLPDRHIEAFLEQLRPARYTEGTLSKKLRVLTAFARWMKSETIALAHLDESTIAAFVRRSTGAPAARVQFELAVLRLLLAYLRRQAEVPLAAPGDESAIDRIHSRYVDYLRQDRGLAENSILVYAPFIRDFLRSQNAGDGRVLPDAFDARTIRDHLLARSNGRSGEYMRLMAVALRSFCHFLFLRGDTLRDLSDSVPTVSKWRQSSVPTFLTPEQEETILASIDRCPAGAVTMQYCFCWHDSAYAQEKSLHSNLMTYAGVRGNSLYTARAKWSSTCRCYPTLARHWRSTFTMIVAQAYPGGSSCERGHHALA